jgi:hypothetical protein
MACGMMSSADAVSLYAVPDRFANCRDVEKREVESLGRIAKWLQGSGHFVSVASRRRRCFRFIAAGWLSRTRNRLTNQTS